MTNSAVEMKKSQKVANWILLVVAVFVIMAAAGFYALTNQDKLNEEILEGTQKVQIKEKDNTPIDSESEAAGLDQELENISENDFAEELLSDVNLSL